MKRILVILFLLMFSYQAFANEEETGASAAGSFHFSGAYGASQVDGKSAQAVLFDFDYGVGQIAIGLHLHIPITEEKDIYGDVETKVPLVTVNFKFFTGQNMDGLFINFGLMALDDGQDDEETEEDESTIIYLAANFGLGYTLSLNQHFSLIAGLDIGSAASEGQVTNTMSAYVGVRF